MTGAGSYRWMSTLLDLLSEGYDREQAMVLLRDEDIRDAAMLALSAPLQQAGMPERMLETHEGRSLFLAVLALRLKFPIDEARAKVERNIAMREGRL